MRFLLFSPEEGSERQKNPKRDERGKDRHKLVCPAWTPLITAITLPVLSDLDADSRKAHSTSTF